MIHVEGTRPSGRRLQRVLSLMERERGEKFSVVNWTGAPLFGSINEMARSDKLKQLIALELSGVRVPPYRLADPGGWHARRAFHEQGRDFTARREVFEPDYYVKYVPTVGEWRVHAFKRGDGKVYSIKASEKRLLPGYVGAHPWVRNHRLGWGQYSAPSPRPIREEAIKAIKALRLDFGAVDVGVLEDGSGVVFEVNTCPGLSGDTLARYAEEIYAIS